MRRTNVYTRWTVWLGLLAGCAAAPAGPAERDLILCGGEEVFIVSGGRKTWIWRADGRPEIPEALRGRFRSTDDCKPVDGGSRILITSSGGGVALVERATGRALFWARVTNAHSAELLPGGRVVVAGSYGQDGNRLVLFDLARPEQELASDSFHGAHGAVWDPVLNRVWALGDNELRAYAVRDRELLETVKMPLPDPGGHDLRAVPGTRKLVVTTNRRVWLFDREELAFEPHPELGALEGVKSVDVDPATGRTAFVKSEESWWAFRVRFLPEGELPLPGEKLYKARWLTSD
jgi:hypothetical protein